MQNGRSRHLVFAKIVVLAMLSILRLVFITDEILTESRRHIDLWSDDVLGHMIYLCGSILYICCILAKYVHPRQS